MVSATQETARGVITRNPGTAFLWSTMDTLMQGKPRDVDTPGMPAIYIYLLEMHATSWAIEATPNAFRRAHA